MLLTQIVYIYRVVLDSVNGVSSTRSTSRAALDLQEGEIRQLQFVEDDTLMVLWSHPSMSPLPLFLFTSALPANSTTEGPSYLLNFPFQPPSTISSGTDAKPPSDLQLEYGNCSASNSGGSGPTKVLPLDILSSPDAPHATLVKHTFAAAGAGRGNRPVRVDVNGRRGRRAVCAVYGDGMRYEVFDMDAEVVEESDDEDEGHENEDE